ncbi:hypothetical protein GS982_01600 [Rhodococcus hoagii]|uniref:Uncharacterized protein n=1 Tax=Rhodococcus hoagii TaxID=43767 RepID=A0A9Q4ZIQ1_RHOHA|nr:hypothetical protein [Prescottella equi]NKT77292.1 hypothetical protein [Prescottella equi]NKZ81079.1 hypothetical protein [Prescottella equi]
MANLKCEKYPFDPECNELVEEPNYRRNIEWRENEPFWGVMTIGRLQRRRSGCRLEIVDRKTGTRYLLADDEIEELLQTGFIDGGLVSGTWIVRKRAGGYYSLMPHRKES